MEIFGVDILGVIMSAGIGALAVMFLDKMYKIILVKFFPAKYLLDFVKNIDDNYIDKFKKQYPEAGMQAEKEIADTLIKMADIILDK